MNFVNTRGLGIHKNQEGKSLISQDITSIIACRLEFSMAEELNIVYTRLTYQHLKDCPGAFCQTGESTDFQVFTILKHFGFRAHILAFYGFMKSEQCFPGIVWNAGLVHSNNPTWTWRFL